MGIFVRGPGRKTLPSRLRSAVEASSRSGHELRMKDLEPRVEVRCLCPKLARHILVSVGGGDRGRP